MSEDTSQSSAIGQSSAITELLTILDLEKLDENLFRGRSPNAGWQRVYGGQVIGQALVAAVRTVVAEKSVHSLHAYFLRPGDPTTPIIYDVDPIRDGKSFTTRRVVARQHGEAIFSMSASFHKTEDGYDHHSDFPDDIAMPEDLPTEAEIAEKFIDRLPENVQKYWKRSRPIEMRPTDISRYLTHEPKTPRQYVWIRATSSLPEDPALHQCVLAYASDFTLLDTALIAHGKSLADTDIQLASLDHALWFHRPVRADEWLLYAQDSPSAHGARGFSRGSVYTRDGVLVASVAQEGLMRRRADRYRSFD